MNIAPSIGVPHHYCTYRDKEWPQISKALGNEKEMGIESDFS